MLGSGEINWIAVSYSKHDGNVFFNYKFSNFFADADNFTLKTFSSKEDVAVPVPNVHLK